jgi:arsenate reductase
MIKIYHNTRCKHSRNGLEYLKSKTDDFEIVEYLKNPLSTEEMEDIIDKLNIEPIDIVRKQEDYYKKSLKGKTLSKAEWVKEFAANPKIIQRPIVINGDKAVIGIPPENIDNIL